MASEAKAFRWLGWLIILLVAGLLGGRPAWATATPAALVPGSTHNEFIGEGFTLPSPSADPPASDSVCFDNAGDTTGYQPAFELVTPAGVTFNSATYLGSAISVSAPQTCSSASGCTFKNPDTNTDVTLADGETLRILRFPLGSFTAAQPAQCLDLSFALGNAPNIQLGVSKTLKVKPFFDLGGDALDNPSTDPPIFGTLQTISINPTVIKHTKNIIAPEDETATGPDYPRTVELTVDVAAGETVNPVTITDVLPNQFQFLAVTNAAGCTPTSTPPTSSPGGNLSLDCGPITGAAGVDKTITFTFYIPQVDAGGTPVLNATTPAPVPITNNSSAAGTYSGSPLPPVSASDTITAKAVALQKNGVIVTPTGPAGLSPGDTVEYTLNGQVSDYFTVEELTVTDTLGDGQTYDAGFTPTVELHSNGTTVGASALNPTEFTVGAKVAGETTVTFDLSEAIIRLIAGSNGQLLGVIGTDTSFVIKLRSTIDNAYSGPVNGTSTLSAGDIVTNRSAVTFNVPGRSPVTENTSSDLAVATPELAKAKYALNGSTSLPNPFQVAAGDTVTYRLTTTLPVSSVENFSLTDYLPIPLYSVSSMSGAGACAGGATPTPPADTAWCYTSDDTISSTAPTVSTDSGLNRITWTYGNRELPSTGGKIDILYTVRATAQPMADRLNLANLAIQSYRDSLSGTDQTAATTAQVVTKQPQLEIKKEITAVSHGSVSATPPAGFDAQATGLDAGDTITYRVRVTNTGSAPAYGIRLNDDAGTLGAFGSPNTCTAPAVTLSGGTALGTTGTLTTGLTMTSPLSGNGDGAVQTNEEIWVSYTCTLAANATPRAADIDNTAVLQNYSNVDVGNPQGLTPVNFATNTALLTRKAKLVTQSTPTITKAITASSLPGSTPDNNINNGETLTFLITVTLTEGVYESFTLGDSAGPIPAITCGSNGFTCTNATVVGSQVTVPATTGSATGTITYTYSQAKTASGTNSATVSATNMTSPTPATATWTVDNPDPDLTKTLSPAGSVNAGDTVQIRLGWPNTDPNNPMFRCVVTDVLDPNVFDLATVTAVTTPVGYAFNYVSGTGTVTYTATDPATVCPTVAAGGAVFSARIRTNVVTGNYTNNASIATFTLPTSGGVQVDDTASAPVPIGAPTVNQKIVKATSLADTTGQAVAIGETVTYQLDFQMAEGVTNGVQLIDQLINSTTAARLAYVPGTATLSRSSTDLIAANNPDGINSAAPNVAIPVNPTISGNTFSINLGNVTNGNATSGTAETYRLTLQFRVTNVTSNTAGSLLQNRAQIRYSDQNNNTQLVTGPGANVRVVLPQVAINKTVTPVAAAGGDVVTYTLTVRNSATGSNAATAYDYTFSDTLPADITPVAGSARANPGATGATVGGLGFSGQVLSGTIDKLDPGEAITVTYRAQLPASIPFGKLLVNSASAAATTLPGADANERTGSGSGPNNLFAGTSATVTSNAVTMTKAIKNAKPFYAIGEEVEYELRLALPVGSASGMRVEDTLPTGLSYVAGSAAVSLVGGVTAPVAGPIAPTATAPLTFNLGTATASPAGEVVIAYRAKVDNLSANQNGTSLTNSARVSYNNPNPGGPTPIVYTAPNPPTARVGEPNLEMTKTILSGAANAQAGSTVRWQFTVSNVGATAARRVAINDVLPANVTVSNPANVAISAVGGVTKESGGPVAEGDITAAPGATAVSVADVVLEPNAVLTIAYDTVIGVGATAGQTLNNVVTANYNSLPVGSTGGRDGSNGGDDDSNAALNNYQESASQALQIASTVTIDKQVTPVTAAVGEIITYQLRIDFIQGTTNSVVVTDQLPDGLAYVGHAVSVGHIGMALSNPSHNTNVGSGQTVRFDLGSVLNEPNGSDKDDFVLVEIFARVRNIVANQNGGSILNGEAAGSPVSVSYNDGAPRTVEFDHDQATPGNQGIPFTVIEPVLGVTKAASPAAQSLGDVVTYTLNVSHQPTSTADAYDVVLTDTLPAGLTYIADSVNPPPAFVSFDAGTRVLRLGYATLPLAEGSRAVSYQARIETSATVGTPLNNAVAMTWASQPNAAGTPDDGRTGADGAGGALNDYATTTSAPVTPTASSSIDAVKTVADLNGGVALPDDVLEYTVVLTNTGSTPATNVVYIDPIPANTTYIDGSLSLNAAPAANAGTATQLQLAVGSLQPGASATIKFQVRINAGVANGVVIRNQGSVDSDQTVPEPTDSDGDDNNGDQPTDIPVGGQPPLTGALYAEKTLAWTDTNNSGSVNAGDTLRYTVTLRNRGAATLTGLSFSDTIPTGLTYVASSASATSGTPAVTGQAVSWTGIADLAPGASQTLNFNVTIGAIAGASQTFTNQGSATSTQTGAVLTDSNGDPGDGSQPTSITATGTGPATPALNVQKRWSLAVDASAIGVVDPGDMVQYTLTVTNTGAQAASNVRLTDAPLPAQFTFVPGSLTTSLGAVVTETPIDVNVGTLNPGQTATISFRMTVNAGTNGQIASNQANATAAGGISANSDDNGNPGDGLNPTLTPIGPVATFAGLSKSLVATSNGGDTSTAVQIGEILTYQIQFNVPAGTTGEVTMLDTLPAGLSYVAGTARLARQFGTGLTASQNPGGVNAAASGAFVPLTDGAEAVAAGQTVSVFLGNVINSGGSSSYLLELQARVDNIAGNQAGAALTDQADLSYRNAAGQLGNLTPATQTATVAEPNVQIAKTASVNAVLPNTASTIRFTVTLTNPAGANVSAAHDISISDILPAAFASATLVSATPSNGVTGETCAFTGTTLNCGATLFPPDGQLVVVYDATTTAALAEGASVTNNSGAQWTSLPEANPGERTGAGGVNDYTAASNVLIRVGTPNLDKTIVNPQTRYAVGDEVSYRVVLSFPGSFNSASFQDVLSAGLSYVPGSLTVEYGTGLTASTPPADFTRTDNAPAAGQETLALAFGTLTNASGDTRTVTLNYRARVDNLLSNQDGQTLPNTATLGYAKPLTGEPASISDAESVTVGEPRLAVTHAITSPTANLEAGDTVNYEVTVTNTGNTTAFETSLRELLPPGLGNVQGISVVLVNTSGGSETPTITVLPDGWQSSPFDLKPGDSVKIVFTATLQNTVQPGQSLQASVDATYSSRDGDDPNQRTGTAAGPDQNDDAALDNYHVAVRSDTFTVGDPVSLNKAFQPEAAKTSYGIGKTVGYRLRLSVGEGTVRAVTVTDTLPAGLTFLDAAIGAGNTGITFSGGAPVQSGQTLTFNLGDLVNPANGNAADDFITLDIRARLDNLPEHQDGVVLGNNAQLRFTDGAGVPQTRDFDADASTPGLQPLNLTVVEPNLALAKTVAPAEQSLGDVVTFTLNVDHTAASTADAFDLTVTDVLPEGLSYVAGSASPAPASVSPDGRTLTWTLASLTRATHQAAISYQARIAAGAVVGVGLTNTASLLYASSPGATGATDSGRTGGGGINDYTGAGTATVRPTANAVIVPSKTVSLAVDANGNGAADPGDALQYSIVLTNTSASPVNNVTLSDSIPANTEYVAGSSSPPGTFGNDTLTVNVGTLNPSASAVVTFQVRVNAGTAAGTLIRNQAIVDSDQTVPTPSNQTETPVVVSRPPSLVAYKTVAVQTDTAPVGVVGFGDTLRYTLVLRNGGSAPLAGLTVNDPIPAGLTYVGGSANPPATLAGSTLTWTNLSVPANGELRLSFDAKIAAFTSAERVFNNEGAVSSPEIGTVPTDANLDPGDGAQPTTITAVSGATGRPKLELRKRWTLQDTAGDGSVNPGDTLLYEVLVANTGSTAASDVRIVDDPLPAQVTLVANSVTTSRGTVAGTNPIAVNVGALNPGETILIGFRVTVNPGTAGQIASNQATAAAANLTGSVSDLTQTPIEGAPGLFDPPSGRKTVNASGFPVLEWRMVWINNGNQAALGVRVTDVIPVGTVYEPNSLRCEPSGGSTVTLCAYDPAQNRVVYEGKIAADPGAVDENAAQNEVVIVFSSRFQAGTTNASNTGTANWDANGDGSVDNDVAAGQQPIKTNSGKATTWDIAEIPTLSQAAMLALLGLLLLMGWRYRQRMS
ncbi:MAG: DUF11 domain-containing protein [Candidatus Competibacteraceae bacterium]|nr:DUF11 domain-containing protein [Candidatus Competibacteraceae bacterium]